ncbi:hypothetical protein [Azoarcus sp. KH32C]|uniref:hypothetical protein n=1 Tax=Azoarcus sp. KH32C TaxID=748247 RepID=UPI0002386186|nr:hypothetical protein [Azoarcus sp. KH32C]BAL25663.1 hypothetical protein AZKH_3374 [Azoarcus sp. KH32C]
MRRSFLGFTVSRAGARLKVADQAIDKLKARVRALTGVWNASKTAHGPWRISKTSALTAALPRRTFQHMGLPELAA